MTFSGQNDLTRLRGDFRFQAEFVVDAAWRLQSMQDGNPLSPSYGCFHYSYWRDKTSEFSDARFQEAGAALGLLSLPFFDQARTDGRLASADTLYRMFSAGLRNLAAQQYPEGCYDEWYKGERGFAATEFTTIAFGLAARCLGDRLIAEDRDRLQHVVAQAGRWLAQRSDRVKANHEAAAAAALACAWEVTGDVAFRVAARAKLDDVLSRQREEGWFPEVGGMDLGYCSVLLDYVMIYTLITGDESAVPAMRKLMAFMLPLLHPDGTISAEMGICLNPYVSRLGIGLLSSHDEAARLLVGLWESSSTGTASIAPYLADDLRVSRWSYLPLVTALMLETFQSTPGGAVAVSHRFPQGWTAYSSAAVCAYHRGDTHVYFSPAGGGGVRVFKGDRLRAEDLGVRLDVDGTQLASSGYDPDRPLAATEHGFAVSSPLGAVRFFQPSFLLRLALRLGSSFAFGSRTIRWLIDRRRIKQRTAANQSAAPLAESGSGYKLERSVTVHGDRVQIVDRLESTTRPIDPAHVTSLLTVAGNMQVTPPSGVPNRSVVLSRSVDLSDSFLDGAARERA